MHRWSSFYRKRSTIRLCMYVCMYVCKVQTKCSKTKVRSQQVHNAHIWGTRKKHAKSATKSLQCKWFKWHLNAHHNYIIPIIFPIFFGGDHGLLIPEFFYTTPQWQETMAPRHMRQFAHFWQPTLSSECWVSPCTTVKDIVKVSRAHVLKNWVGGYNVFGPYKYQRPIHLYYRYCKTEFNGKSTFEKLKVAVIL